MRTSQIIAEFDSPPKEVFTLVTDTQLTSWRSDIVSTTPSIDNKTYVETRENGFQTRFTVTQYEPYKKYAYILQNSKFSGTGFCMFTETLEGGTRIILLQKLDIRNPFKRFLSYFSIHMKKLQKQYVQDIRNAL